MKNFLKQREKKSRNITVIDRKNKTELIVTNQTTTSTNDKSNYRLGLLLLFLIFWKVLLKIIMIVYSDEYDNVYLLVTKQNDPKDIQSCRASLFGYGQLLLKFTQA